MIDRLELIAALARAIDAATAEKDGVDRASAIVLDLARRLGTQHVLPGITPPMTAKQNGHATVARLFAYWQSSCGYPSAKLTGDRVTAVSNRLREGYTETEIRKAIDGAAAHAYRDEESGRKYDDIALICRSGSKLESFISRGEAATGPLRVETALANDTPVENQIGDLRRKMSELRKAGRQTEYNQASAELVKLMAQRERKAS